jgi:hypothetical protein
MTVVQLEAARRQLRPSDWDREEKAELMRLYAAVARDCGAADYEFGETDRSEPQFYIVDDNPGAACITCVSRLSKHSKPWYVIEDGSGGLLSEGFSLRSLIERASAWRGWGGSLLLALPLFEHRNAGWTVLETEIAIASYLDVWSPEAFLCWASQLLAFA